MSANPPNATAESSSGGANAPDHQSAEVIKALGTMLKSQTGEPITNERISALLLQNMAQLVQQGKLTQRQIMQVRTDLPPFFDLIVDFAMKLKQFADQHKANPSSATSANANVARGATPTTQVPAGTSANAAENATKVCSVFFVFVIVFSISVPNSGFHSSNPTIWDASSYKTWDL